MGQLGHPRPARGGDQADAGTATHRCRSAPRCLRHGSSLPPPPGLLPPLPLFVIPLSSRLCSALLQLLAAIIPGTAAPADCSAPLPAAADRGFNDSPTAAGLLPPPRLPARVPVPPLPAPPNPHSSSGLGRDERGAAASPGGSVRSALASCPSSQPPGTPAIPPEAPAPRGSPGQASAAKGRDAAELEATQADSTSHSPQGRERDNCSSVLVRCFSKHHGAGLCRGSEQAGDWFCLP